MSKMIIEKNMGGELKDNCYSHKNN